MATDKGRLAVLRAMAEAVHKTGNSVLVDKHAQKTALRLGVTPDAVRVEFKKLSRAKSPSPEPVEPPPETIPEPQRPSTAEHWLLKLLLRHDELVGWAVANVDPGWVRHPLAKQIVARLLAAHANQTWTSLAAFLDECEAPEMRSLITEITAEPRPIPNPTQQLADLALRLRNQSIERQMAALVQRASQPEIGEAERLDLLREQQELRKLKATPIAAELP